MSIRKRPPRRRPNIPSLDLRGEFNEVRVRIIRWANAHIKDCEERNAFIHRTTMRAHRFRDKFDQPKEVT